MSVRRVRCSLCHAAGVRHFCLRGYHILECPRCGLAWCSPVPDEEELRRFYAKSYRPEDERDWKTAQERRLVALQLRSLAPHARTLLDVGCGFGHFLDAARVAGFECYGTEADAVRGGAAERKGHVVHRGFLEACPPGRLFDVVVLSHVIEHLRDPLSVLAQVRALLSPGGVLFVETPNFIGLKARLSGRRYVAYIPPEHLLYFRPHALRVLLERAGFEPIRITTRSGYLIGKDILSHFLRMRFVKSEEELARSSPRPFVEGRFPFLRRSIYGAALSAGACLAPLLIGRGGENLVAFCRSS